jgi:ribosomal protein S21
MTTALTREPTMKIEVFNNDVAGALKRLTKKLKASGLFGELRQREEARGKSQKRREKHARALRRQRRRDRALKDIKDGIVVPEIPTNLHRPQS